MFVQYTTATNYHFITADGDTMWRRLVVMKTLIEAKYSQLIVVGYKIDLQYIDIDRLELDIGLYSCMMVI